MDQNAMMEAWMKASTPGEAHQRLAPMVGVWSAETTVWMGDNEPMVQRGAVQKEWMLDNRFIRQTFTGESSPMGQFFGFGLLGYNNIARQYESVWVDTMSTAMMLQHGDFEGDELVLTGDQHESITMGTVRVRSVNTIIGPDEHLFENYVKGEGGEEKRTLRVVYTRA